MNIYFIRHGEDDEKYRGGWSELPLIQVGIDKANKLGKYLKKNMDKYRLEKIISSDLTRTRMTADIINTYLDLPISIDERLRENNNGELAGMLNSEAIKKYPNCFFGSLGYDERFPGGESPHEFYDRVKKSFYELIEENNNVKNLMIVTHAGVISIIYHIVTNLEWTNKEKSLKISKTSISKLIVDESGNMKFDYINDTPHLR